MSEVASRQRARGRTLLSARRRGAATAIADLSIAGSAKLLFPRPRGTALEAVALNTAGGITGGDAFEHALHLADGAAVRLTTQAAERVYRARDDDAPGRVRTRVEMGAGADLAWLPQETILFDGAALDRGLDIAMPGSARLLLCETLIFGRAAMGERVKALRLADRIDLRRDGRLVLADRLRLAGDAQGALDGAAVAGGAGAMATLVLAWPGASQRLDEMRAMLGARGGASALDADLVFARVLANDGFTLRAVLVPVLRALSGGDLPRPWML